MPPTTSSAAAEDLYDVIVVGAGPAGLSMAKTYHQIHPDDRLLILEAHSTAGGTWSKERMYKDLKSNNLYGTFNFPDFPMDTEKYGVAPGKTIPGPTMHRYFVDYAKSFGIYDFITFNQKVQKTEKNNSGGWKLVAQTTGDETASETVYLTKRLVVASGLTSTPNIPSVPGASEFEGQMFHIKDFGLHAPENGPGSRIAVIGGAKSAYDSIYAYASRGYQVEWIIRPNGKGPIWMTPSYVTPLKLWIEQLVTTRFLTWFVPCTWSKADGYSGARWFLHQTWLGQKIVAGFAAVMDNDLTTLAGYDKHESTKKLKPWFSSLNVGANLSILNYPTDFYEYVRSGQVRIHIADVDHLSKDSTLHLSTGEALKIDTLFFATGWRYTPGFLSGLEEDLGIAHNLRGPDVLAKEADAAILGQYPQLAQNDFRRYVPEGVETGDVKPPRERSSPSYRLHRFIVPPRYFADRSIVMASACFTLRTLTQAHVAALWAVAFFDGRLAQQQPGHVPSLADIEYEAALHAQSGRWTTPGGYAGKVPDVVFQHLPLLDLLLADLGLQRWRKIEQSRQHGGYFAWLTGRVREIFEPYMPTDHRDIVDEWMKKEQKDR